MLFASAAFARLLHRLSGVAPRSRRAEARRFRPGMDYTVATYAAMPEEGEALLDAVLTAVGTGTGTGTTGTTGTDAAAAAAAAAAAWESGEFGGFEAYVEADADEAAEASAVFRLDDVSEPLVQNLLSHNSLSLVMRDSGVLRFVKYVSAAAPGSRFDVSAEYGLDPVGASDGEEDTQ